MSRIGSDPTSRDSPGDAGFSLLEMLVVMAIVGLCIALLPPLTRGQQERTSLRSAVSMITADLRASRQAAMTERKPVSMVFDAATNRYHQTINGRWRGLPSETTVRLSPVRAADPGMTPAITFYPDGTSSGGEIHLANGASARRLMISWPFGQLSHD